MIKSPASLLYEFVAQIPKGKVSTYGRLATLTDLHSRQVGKLLHRNPDPQAIPCHRVVNSVGRLASAYAFGGASAQRERLQQEGVVFLKNSWQVDLQKSLWEF